MLYIFFSLVHPPPPLVSHPCPYLSARPIGHFFWRSVSCCGPHRTVQGSRPHKWGQGVSCRYSIRRWQLLLGLLFYHAPMADPLGSESPLGSSRGLPLAMWRLPLLWFWSAEDKVVLGSIFWQSGFTSFVLGHFFLLGVGLGLDMEWAEVSRSPWPHIRNIKKKANEKQSKEIKRKQMKSKVTCKGALYIGEGSTEVSNLSFTLSCLV